jgi:hypothetical protein
MTMMLTVRRNCCCGRCYLRLQLCRPLMISWSWTRAVLLRCKLSLLLLCDCCRWSCVALMSGTQTAAKLTLAFLLRPIWQVQQVQPHQYMRP